MNVPILFGSFAKTLRLPRSRRAAQARCKPLMRFATFAKQVVPKEWRQKLKRSLFKQQDMLARLQNLKRAGCAPAFAIDVGAFEGSWTRECKSVWPDAKVLMVEPLPEKRSKLQA